MPATDADAPAVQSQVRELVTLISRAAKNYQVYLPNNRMFLTSLAEAGQALQRFLEEDEVLTLVVKEFELLYEKVPVYSNQDKHQSLAFRMYRDGVRLISFHRGINDSELTAFFEALTRCLECERLEEDFVTLLWEKDLQCITYYEVSDDGADGRGRSGLENTDPEFHPTGSEMSEAEWREVAADLEGVLPALDLTQGDLEEVKNLAMVVTDDRFLERARQVLSSTFDICSTRDACLDLENAVTGFLDLCVQTGHLATASDALAELKSRLAAVPDPDVRSALSRIVDSRHGKANMEAIGAILDGDRDAGHEQCLAYLTQMGPAALPSVIDLLPRCGSQAARHVVMISLAALAGDDPARLVELVSKRAEPEIDVALDALTAIGTDAALDAAMRFRQHPSPKVRIKVLGLAPRIKNGAGADVAQSMTSDENSLVRRRALTSLAEIGGERCVRTLLDLFTSKEFNALPRDKKAGLLTVARSLPPEDQKRVVDAVFQMRSWFRPKPLDETKAVVVEMLPLLHGDVVNHFAENLAERAPECLQKAIAGALRKAWRNADRS